MTPLTRLVRITSAGLTLVMVVPLFVFSGAWLLPIAAQAATAHASSRPTAHQQAPGATQRPLKKKRKKCIRRQRVRVGNRWVRKKVNRCLPKAPAPVVPTAGAPTPLSAPESSGSHNHCGTLSTSETWTADQLHRLTCTLTIPTGVVVRVQPGAIVKADLGVAIRVAGQLLVDGTASAPVTLTSVHDNSIGGITGSGAPTTSDWTGVASVDPHAVVHLDNVVITQAAIALDGQAGQDLRVRGQLVRDAVGARTAAWTPDWWNLYGALLAPIPLLDARHVDWGSPSGPAPMGTGTTVTGNGVVTLPYAGFEMPNLPVVAAQSAPSDTRCTSLTVLGLRGSNEAPVPANNVPSIDSPFTYATDEDGAGWVAHAVATGAVAYLSANRPAATWRVLGIHYPALMLPEVARYPYPEFVRSNMYGGIQLKNVIDAESARCPASRFLIAGYSQGASAARIGLGLMAQDPALKRVIGVVLIGDPSKPANEQREHIWDRSLPENQPPGSAISDAAATSPARSVPGLFHQLAPTLFAPLPNWLAAHTWSACHPLDLFCATGPGSIFNEHMNYTGSDPTAMGYQAIASGIGELSTG